MSEPSNIIYDDGSEKLQYRKHLSGESTYCPGLTLLDKFSNASDVDFLFNQMRNVLTMNQTFENFKLLANIRGLKINKNHEYISYDGQMIEFLELDLDEINQQFTTFDPASNSFDLDGGDINFIFKKRENKWYVQEDKYIIPLSIACFMSLMLVEIKENSINIGKVRGLKTDKTQQEVTLEFIFENKNWAMSVYNEVSNSTPLLKDQIKQFYNSSDPLGKVEVNLLEILSIIGELRDLNDIKSETLKPSQKITL